MKITIPKIEKESVRKIIENKKRLDNRKFDEYRKIELKTGVYERAEGSANCKIGNTQVAVGVKVGEGEPYPDSPDVGVLITTAELVPTASPLYQPGPPSENAIELARVVDRGLRESKAIELEKLCIEPEVKVRTVFVDNYVLDYAGNFIDTAALGAIAALHTAEIPDEGKLPVVKKPIANTFIKVGENILLDPSLEEEHVLDARLTITIEDKDNVCAMQKAGSGFWTQEEIMQCVKTAIKKTKEMRKLVK